ncbi:HisA/HisF-related TIM barrel protein [Pontimonas sp.]|nr:HisA/HisF-related TIM barrel protein [Pontimonas sp.]MDA8862987.1 HisA/HisF-related TIM barrel protein [Pontimonas sp.]
MLPRAITTITIDAGRAMFNYRFRPKFYLGDPINIARLYSRMGSDEVLVLDRSPKLFLEDFRPAYLGSVCRQVSTPVSYGGGLKAFDDVVWAFRAGVDRVVFNDSSKYALDLIEQASQVYGRQAVVGMVNYDVRPWRKRARLGGTSESLAGRIRDLTDAGVGEIFLQSVNRSGTRRGLDTSRVKSFPALSKIPISISGGARDLTDFDAAFKFGFSAVAASSIFALDSSGKTPLIGYLSEDDRRRMGWL